MEITFAGLIFAFIIVYWFVGDDISAALKSRREHKARLREKEAQKELEERRFEHLKELMTEAAINDDPRALEAVKPLAEALAKQIGIDNTKQLKENTEDD
ncbi:hypothetical protein KJ885_05115 [Patescibacteria group bacterium]|nr:hypothetical protein [Patescibacteria group bacterium]